MFCPGPLSCKLQLQCLYINHLNVLPRTAFLQIAITMSLYQSIIKRTEQKEDFKITAWNRKENPKITVWNRKKSNRNQLNKIIREEILKPSSSYQPNLEETLKKLKESN